jgi:hypothetical protein
MDYMSVGRRKRVEAPSTDDGWETEEIDAKYWQ